MTNPNLAHRILLLCQTHAHTAALMGCIPHLQAHYGWVWVVYSPAVLADPALVEKEFDSQIADLSRAAKECYAREDGAGGDAYKAKRDAAILEKSAKVKDAWKALPKEAQSEAVNKLFKPFFDALHGVEGISVAITQGPDHFEPAAHVEMQNSLKAGMKPGYVPGDYVVAWPTSLPKGGEGVLVGLIPPKPTLAGKVEIATQSESIATQALETAHMALRKQEEEKIRSAQQAAVKIDKRTAKYKARHRELSVMSLDDLGPIAFELGIKPGDKIAGKKDDLIERIIELEFTGADVNAY